MWEYYNLPNQLTSQSPFVLRENARTEMKLYQNNGGKL